jgi:hypothetical protein
LTGNVSVVELFYGDRVASRTNFIQVSRRFITINCGFYQKQNNKRPGENTVFSSERKLSALNTKSFKNRLDGFFFKFSSPETSVLITITAVNVF